MTAKSPISHSELVAMLAVMAATIALSIDGMLPVLPQISADLLSNDSNRVQLVVAAFFGGLGIGTLFTGPLSDAFGRHTVAVGGAAVYIAASLFAAFAQSLEILLIARVLQGLGAAGPRIVSLAIVRDLFVGRQMARIMSFIMMVFLLIPIIAPTVGAGIAFAFGWRAIFAAFALFSLLSTVWLVMRQPETLPVEKRRPFRIPNLLSGIVEVLGTKQVLLATLAQTLIFSVLMAMLMSSQQIFEDVFDKGDSFHYWFGFMALAATPANLLNAAIVVRFGMRKVVLVALIVEVVITSIYLFTLTSGLIEGSFTFPIAIFWMISVFYLVGLGVGNLNAIAMEPMGHMAGMAASVVAATATITSVIVSIPIGQAFDGTIIPLTLGVLVLIVGATIIVFAIAESEDTQA